MTNLPPLPVLPLFYFNCFCSSNLLPFFSTTSSCFCFVFSHPRSPFLIMQIFISNSVHTENSARTVLLSLFIPPPSDLFLSSPLPLFPYSVTFPAFVIWTSTKPPLLHLLHSGLPPPYVSPGLLYFLLIYFSVSLRNWNPESD